MPSIGGTGPRKNCAIYFNRSLKKAHLLRWPHPLSFRRRFNYVSFRGISAALSLDLFEQPVKNEFFRNLLIDLNRFTKTTRHHVPFAFLPLWSRLNSFPFGMD